MVERPEAENALQDPILDFAVHLARQAGELLEGYYQTSRLATRLKEDYSVVTEADLASDHWITNEIQASYPQESLLSEELQTRSPDEAGPMWVIDPLDGTTNFSLGLPFWGVLIARLEGGWPQLAALYFPELDELYTAKRGAGAYLNGDRLQVDPQADQYPATFFSCCSRTFQRYQVSIPYKPRILGSAGYSLCSLARNIAIIAFDATPKIWDLAGPWLVVKEAGGIIEPLEGPAPFPIQPGLDYKKQSFPTLAAVSERLMARGREGIKKKSNG